MAINKKNEFEKDEIALAALGKALGHPARIAILKELASRGNCICGEIVRVMPLAQSTVSQHLKELKDSGLIKGTIEGAKSCYCIDREKLAVLNALLSGFLAKVSEVNKEDECC